MSGLLLGIVLSVCTCWFHNMVTLPPRLVSTDFGTCSYQCFLFNFTPASLHMLKCSCAHTLSCLFMYCSFASIGHADIIWSIVSSNFIIIIIIIIIIAVSCYISFNNFLLICVLVLGMFAKLRKANIRLLSVCPSVRMKQLSTTGWTLWNLKFVFFESASRKSKFN